MSNTGVFAPPHGVVFAPHWGGGAEKNFFATRTYPPYLYLTPPTFQILEISLVLICVQMWIYEYDHSSTCDIELIRYILTRQRALQPRGGVCCL